jgi:hypothetical protein
MNLSFAKLIAYHLAGEGGVEDSQSHLPWAFAHAIGNLPGPADESGIYSSDGAPIVRWLVDGDVPRLFTVVGQVIPNDQDELRPFAVVSVSSLQLRPDRWSIDLASQYGAVKHGHGYRQQWSFTHRDDECIVIETERAWDGEEEWFEKSEVFARALAGYLGWDVEDRTATSMAAA